jgi:hypothetical protein
VAHYNAERPHRGLDLPRPAATCPSQAGHQIVRRVARRDVLGGLIHEYYLDTA